MKLGWLRLGGPEEGVKGFVYYMQMVGWLQWAVSQIQCSTYNCSSIGTKGFIVKA